MSYLRPGTVGNYELLEHFDAPEASVRVLRMSRSNQAIDPHLHHRSMQIYVALEGRAVVECDGEMNSLEPYQALVVRPETVHGAYPASETAIVLNISIPPLSGDDQVAVPRFEASARWGAS